MAPDENFGAGPRPILFVNYHGTIGGGQVHLLTLLKKLDRAKFAPRVICCQEGPFAAALRALQIPCTVVPFGKGKLRHLTVSLPAMWKVYSYLKREGIRLVQVGGLQEAKLAAWPAAAARVPMLWLVAP